jgi:hypothetical protein
LKKFFLPTIFFAIAFLYFALEFLISFNWDPAHLTERYFFEVGQRHYQMAIPDHLEADPQRVNFHILFGLVLLISGALQLSEKLRIRHPRFHRVLGYVYFVTGLVVVLLGLAMAGKALGGASTKLAFWVFAGLWLVTMGFTFFHIKKRNLALHKKWSIRNYYASLATGLIRPNLFIIDLMLPGQSPEVLFSMSCWFSIVITMVICEWATV